jgi:hypothetical protein
MAGFERFEDLLPEWRQLNAGRLSKKAVAIADDATANFSAKTDTTTLLQQLSVSDAFKSAVSQFAVDELLPSCLDWLTERQCGPPGSIRDRVRAEATVALRQRLPAFQPRSPLPRLLIPYTSWALPASGGAALGSLALTPLSLLLLGQREPGLLVGGIFGAGLAVGLIAWLSQRPKLLSGLQKVIGATSLLTAIGGIVAVYRAQSVRLLKAAGWITGCWILLLLVRPRLVGPSRAECHEALLPQAELLLAQAADLALALCWTHPDAKKGDYENKLEGSTIPDRVVDAIGVLNAVSEDENAPDHHLRNAIRALLQRVREEGYQWQIVAEGTPYDVSLEERFDCFGMIEIGQTVEMLEPARIRNGKPDKRGQLRAL